MKLLRKRDIPEDKYSNAFLGYGPEDSNFTVELTYSELIIECQLLNFVKLWVCYATYTEWFLIYNACYFMAIADYGVDSYNIGTGFGHFGIVAEDVSSSNDNKALLFIPVTYAMHSIYLSFTL